MSQKSREAKRARQNIEPRAGPQAHGVDQSVSQGLRQACQKAPLEACGPPSNGFLKQVMNGRIHEGEM